MPHLEKEFKKNHPSVNLFFNYASSGQLRSQILNGATADIFIPVSGTKIINKNVKILAKNRLVLITDNNNNNIKQIFDLTQPWVKKIAIGNPMIVPAGTAAVEYLKHFKIFPFSYHNKIFNKNIRARPRTFYWYRA